MLSRVMREGRANLMARAMVDEQVVLATLYHPYLSLVEAALNDPKQARGKTPQWIERKLLRTYVELRSPRALNLVDVVHRMSLRERHSGKSYPALALVEQRRSDQGWRARVFFESPAWSTNEPFLSVELEIPGSKTSGTATWGISPRTLTTLNRLPIVYELAPLRAVRMARRALVRGEASTATQLLEDVPQCAPCFVVAEQLKKLAAALPSAQPAPAESEEPGQDNSASAESRDDSRGESRAPRIGEANTKRREAVLRRLWPLGGALVEDKAYAEANRLLGELRAAKDDVKRGQRAAAFDQQLARVLRRALDPLSRVGQLDAARSAKATDEGATELRRRLTYANAGLVPHFVDGSQHGPVALSEKQPLLLAEEKSGFTIRARVRQRIGQGWLHPGLPLLKYRLQLVDNARAYWAKRVQAASSIERLEKVAREMLKREMRGPDPVATEAALRGWVAVEGRNALELVSALAEGPSAERAAAALLALGTMSRTPVVRKLVKKYVDVKEPHLRAAALILDGQLNQALSDPSPQVARAALAAMLHRGQGVGAAKKWLKGPDQRRRDTLILLARHGAAASLKRELTQLYKNNPALRRLVVEAARGEHFRPLLLQAATDDDVAVRQAAMERLASMPRPPRAVLEAALKDNNERVRLAAHVGLVRLGQSRSLLALGGGARGGCGERQVVLEALISRMDRGSGRKLLIETLGAAGCPDLATQAWKVAAAYFGGDASVLRVGMSHSSRRVRVAAALTVLGVGTRKEKVGRPRRR